MKSTTAIVVSSAVLAIVATTFLVTRGAGANNGRMSYWDEEIESYIRRKIAATYVDRVDRDEGRKAFYRAMDAYVQLDRYSEFIDPVEYARWKEETHGRYAGLGIKIMGVDQGLHITGVWPGGPADQAGVQVGDTMVEAGGQSLAGKDVDAITKILKGTANTAVRVMVIRGPRPKEGPVKGPLYELTVTRGVIRPPTLFKRLVGENKDIGVLRLTDFAQESESAFQAAVTEMVQRHRVRGLVIDLRHNGGGVLDVATNIVDRFVCQGVIVRMEGRGRGARRNMVARRQKRDLLKIPLVVLVDGRSASASEVVAGALQDHRRAVVVGSRTYGKFLVQSISEIPRRGAALKLTTSRYYLPSGRSYQGPLENGASKDEPAGLLPDVTVTLTDDQRTRLLEQWFNEEGRPWKETPRFDVPPDEIDPQLAKAIQVLNGEVAVQRIRPDPKPRRNG